MEVSVEDQWTNARDCSYDKIFFYIALVTAEMPRTRKESKERIIYQS